MELLFKGKYYKVNAVFWTAVKYRLEYGKSVFDIGGENDFYDKIKSYINLLYIAIEGEKPALSELLEDAVKVESRLLDFCILLHNKITKHYNLYEKYTKILNEKSLCIKAEEKKRDDFDELDILLMFSQTNLPERMLDEASVYQVIGMYAGYMIEKNKPYSGSSEPKYIDMSMIDIKSFYGVI